MEVFVGFTKDSDFFLLKKTLTRWKKCKGVSDVNAIQCNKKFEIARRVAADRMAKEKYYILADLGCVPERTTVTKIAERIAMVDRKVGLIGLGRKGTETVNPTGVRICRKNFVQKWMSQVTETYDAEHAGSVRLAGTVTVWPDVFYKTIHAKN